MAAALSAAMAAKLKKRMMEDVLGVGFGEVELGMRDALLQRGCITSYVSGSAAGALQH
jgi:hypothetical protein